MAFDDGKKTLGDSCQMAAIFHRSCVTFCAEFLAAFSYSSLNVGSVFLKAIIGYKSRYQKGHFEPSFNVFEWHDMLPKFKTYAILEMDKSIKSELAQALVFGWKWTFAIAFGSIDSE